MSNKCGGGRCVSSVTFFVWRCENTRAFKKQKCLRKEERTGLWFNPLKPIRSNHTYRNHNSPKLALVYPPLARSASWLLCAGWCKLFPVWACTLGQALQLYQAMARFGAYFSWLGRIKFYHTFCQATLTFSWRILLNDGALGRRNGLKKKMKEGTGLCFIMLETEMSE